jgi:glycosyltransferase involved in cell wall biosynthesis
VTTPVDVVIPTRDRPAQLRGLLEDLRAQRPAPRQIIVVDDSRASLRWESEFADLPLRVERPNERVFISRAKNLGWRGGSSPLVAFVDDDNRIPPGLLGRLASDLDVHPEWGAVMPGVVYLRRPETVWVYAAPFRPGGWTFDLVGRNARRDGRIERSPMPTDALPNLSMVRRTALVGAGGFDERLPVNSSADLCQRLKRAGWQAWADPGALTYHDVEPPGAVGYWAEHTLDDPARHRLETADWVRFHARWNGSEEWFRLRAGYHSLGFLVPHFLAVSVRAPSSLARHAVAAIAGFRDGLRDRSELSLTSTLTPPR